MKEATSSLALDFPDPLKATDHICNIELSVFGMDYLREMVVRTATLTGFSHALIGRLNPDNKKMVSTDILWKRGRFQNNVSYELKGTPCENVFSGDRVCVYSQDVRKLFPHDQLLTQMRINSYIGSPLLSPDNQMLGIVAFMSNRSIVLSENFISVFEFLASRAGMELAREGLKNKLIEKEGKAFQEKRLASLGQLVNGVAHDFNNLLAGLMGHAELLDMKLEADHQAAPHVRGILQSIQRAKNITRQLLDFAKPQVNLNKTVSANLVAEELQALLEPTLEQGLQLEIETESSEIIAIIDGTHLQQVVLNLVLNARDSMPSGGSIRVKVDKVESSGLDELSHLPRGDFVRISVSDSGVGIKPDCLDKIFDPFYSTKEVGKGSGLGLAGVYNLTQTYGGVVSVVSTVGHGSTFTLYLPSANKHSKPEVIPKQYSQPATKRLLLAEDDETIASTMSEYLTMKGYEVALAKNGAEALTMIRATSQPASEFDLVIADLNMPKLNGKELLEKAFVLAPNMKAILSTGDPGKLSSKMIGESDNYSILVKPYVFSKLLDTINRLLTLKIDIPVDHQCMPSGQVKALQSDGH